MTRGNVETVRDAYAAWNESAFENWKSMHREDVVVIPPEGFPEGTPTEDRDESLS